jgi:hypothetical protein
MIKCIYRTILFGLKVVNIGQKLKEKKRGMRTFNKNGD